MLSPQDRVIATFLLDLALIIVVSGLFAVLARKLRQPAVVGEIVAGLALGPSLLGALPGHLDQVLFPADVRALLTPIAQLGLVLFMFLIGFELDPAHIRGSGRTLAFTAVASIVVPFGLGLGLGVVLHPWHGSVGTLSFGLFTGTAMAITAFPVLARLLAEHGLTRQRTGVLAMVCAAVNDVVAWCLLAVVVTIVAATGPGNVTRMVLGLAGYAAVILLVVRPGLRRVIAALRGRRNAGPVLFVIVVAGLLLSSWATAVTGLHPVFGAFVFGALLPRAEIREVAPDIPRQVGRLNVILLPVFFVTTGLSANVRGLGWNGLAEVAAVVVVACVGKFAGAGVIAFARQHTVRDALILGALLNTRGLTELIVLGIGLQVGVLDQRMFTVMVLMAVLTTVIASPLLRLLKATGAGEPVSVAESETAPVRQGPGG
jgi:Kef-type K+ transport system membrane component KefB